MRFSVHRGRSLFDPDQYPAAVSPPPRMKRRSFITLLGGTPTTTTTTTTRHDALRAATVLRRLSADVLMFASVGWARTADSRPCMPSLNSTSSRDGALLALAQSNLRTARRPQRNTILKIGLSHRPAVRRSRGRPDAAPTREHGIAGKRCPSGPKSSSLKDGNGAGAPPRAPIPWRGFPLGARLGRSIMDVTRC
jgi:hypothetical protein